MNTIEFEEAISRGKVVIDFYADWCVPCRTLSPMLHELEHEFNFHLFKVNVDQAQDLANKFKVTKLPTLLRFEDGNLIDRLEGLPNKQDLRTFFRR